MHPNIRSSRLVVSREKGVPKNLLNSQKTPMPESRFHLDYLLLFLRFPLLTLRMNSNFCCLDS